LDPKLDVNDAGKVREIVSDLFGQVLIEEDILVPKESRQALLDAIMAEIVGLGPIQVLLDDPTVSEVMVNGPHRIFVERTGKLQPTQVEFDADAHVRRIIERIISPLGRRCDESSPLVDARLNDGSRVNAIIPPLALDGSTITIRKFPTYKITVDDLVKWGSLTPELADFLRACVVGRFNIVVSGGTGSGKTTLLNVLSSFIPEDERIITVEDAAELQLDQVHWVRLETRKPNIEGKGAVTIRDLVINTLRMRPDRVVIGECRGGEALDMIQAMNTGHDGSLTTLHSNNPRECISRLEVLMMMAGMDLPLSAIRKQIAGAVQLIIQQSRLQDGSRRVTHVTEVQGMEGETVTLQDIFLFEQTGVTEGGKILGALRATGLRPKNVHKFQEHGITLPAHIFAP
jgi:pilus assembly protein CpaF